MKNWKTTLGGVLGAGGLAIQHFTPQYAVFGLAMSAAATMWLGYHASDAAKE